MGSADRRARYGAPLTGPQRRRVAHKARMSRAQRLALLGWGEIA